MINKYKILNSKKYFSSAILQIYLVFISTNKYFNIFNPTTQIYLWKSNGISQESTENITTSDNNFTPTLVNFYTLRGVKFNGNSKKVINLYISYALDACSGNLNIFFSFGNCLFGFVELTKNTDLVKYKYSGFGIRFDSHSEFSLTGGGVDFNSW